MRGTLILLEQVGKLTLFQHFVVDVAKVLHSIEPAQKEGIVRSVISFLLAAGFIVEVFESYSKEHGRLRWPRSKNGKGIQYGYKLKWDLLK